MHSVTAWRQPTAWCDHQWSELREFPRCRLAPRHAVTYYPGMMGFTPARLQPQPCTPVRLATCACRAAPSSGCLEPSCGRPCRVHLLGPWPHQSGPPSAAPGEPAPGAPASPPAPWKAGLPAWSKPMALRHQTAVLRPPSQTSVHTRSGGSGCGTQQEGFSGNQKASTWNPSKASTCRSTSALQAGLAACQLHAVPPRADSTAAGRAPSTAEPSALRCAARALPHHSQGDAAAEAVRLHIRGR